MSRLSIKVIHYLDFRLLFVVLALMFISLLVISSNELQVNPQVEESFFTPRVISQIQWFVIGFGVFFFFACLDYNSLREWTWILYFIMIVALIGLFFTEGSKNVQRWYRIPGINMRLQPSEFAKLIIVLTLAWFLERRQAVVQRLSTSFLAFLIVGIPFLLIYKQPDLGTALLLYPITLVMFYFGKISKKVVRTMMLLASVVLAIVLLFFLKIVSHEEMRPYARTVLKEYQYERLNPSTHHQKQAKIAISVGGLKGSGWKKGAFTRRGWLPEAQTDSVFPAFVEEFGLVGAATLLLLFYLLLYFSFQVIAVAKDYFSCLLSAGITAYLAMHVIINIAMMSGLLPITGVPLLLVSYGGSSVLATMAALGMLQSIYSRRFRFVW